jgi:RHS repeat-associated protein
MEGATLTYHHRDLLSVRVNTDGTTGAVVGEQGHYPYGEVWYSTGTTTKYLFTSYERDPESNNDYAMYRYHANRLGRFTSPDPVNGSPTNPQSLNRYAYTTNDPVNLTDPNGLCTIEVVCSLIPLGCVVYENCSHPIPRPESPPPREDFGFGFDFGFGIRIARTNLIFNGVEGPYCLYDLYCPNGNTAASCPVSKFRVRGNYQSCLNYVWVFSLVVDGRCFRVGLFLRSTVPISCN